MLSVVRFSEGAPEREVLDQAETALAALAHRPGFTRGRLARATDDGGGWLLVTEWVSVGAWRRALSSYEVKLAATGLLAQAPDEPSSYEVLLDMDEAGAPTRRASDRAATEG